MGRLFLQQCNHLIIYCTTFLRCYNIICILSVIHLYHTLYHDIHYADIQENVCGVPNLYMYQMYGA